MAIVSGLPAGAVLWKFSEMRRVYRYNPEERRHMHMDVMCYFTVELYSRRARSNGSYINKELYPFLNKLKIRLNEEEFYRDGGYEPAYRAIGVQIREHLSQERWEALEVHETALKYYKKLKNGNITPILNRHSEFNENEIIEEMKAAAVDFELETEWPDEPAFSIHARNVSSAAW
jgi:hypothetical protein